MRHILFPAFLVGCVSDSVVSMNLDSGMPVDGQTLDSPMMMGDGAMMDGPAMLTDVNVRVIDDFGAPIGSANVQIGAQNAMTKPDGTCTLQAPPTYDLYVAAAAPTLVTTKRVVGFVGLTTRTPTVELAASVPRKTSFNITVSGGTYTNGDVVRVLYSPTTHSSSLNLSSIRRRIRT